MKYFLGMLQERNGEYEYRHYTPIEMADEVNPYEWFDNYASEFYPGDAESEDDGYYFFGGGIFICVDTLTQITAEEFGVLRRLGI